MLQSVFARLAGLAAGMSPRAFLRLIPVVAPMMVGMAMFDSAAAVIDESQKAGVCLTLSADGADNTCSTEVQGRYEDGDGAQLTIAAMTSVAITDSAYDGRLAACVSPFYPVSVVVPTDTSMAATWTCDDGKAPAVTDMGGGGAGGGDGGTSSIEHFALGAGIVILAGAAFGAWQDGDAAAFSMTPVGDSSYVNGAWRSRHGTRLDYRRDEWTLWWLAETGISGGGAAEEAARYGWGGAWRGEVVRLDAAAVISDGTTDLRAGAGAALDFNGWALHPTWGVRAETRESGGWDGRMDAGLAAEWARLGWQVRPSLGAAGSLTDAADYEGFMRLRVERTLGW